MQTNQRLGQRIQIQGLYGGQVSFFIRVAIYVHISVHTYQYKHETRSSWLNCALRDDEAVYWVSIGHYEAVAVSN